MRYVLIIYYLASPYNNLKNRPDTPFAYFGNIIITILYIAYYEVCTNHILLFKADFYKSIFKLRWLRYKYPVYTLLYFHSRKYKRVSLGVRSAKKGTPWHLS
jgi:hypothetical protein